MKFYNISKNNFASEKIHSGSIDLMLMSNMLMKISKKFSDTSKIRGFSFLILPHNVEIISIPNTDSIFKINKQTNVIVSKYNSIVELKYDGEQRFFSANEVNLKGFSTKPLTNTSDLLEINPPANFNEQEKLAFYWLMTDGISHSAKSICFFTFPSVKEIYEKETDQEFEFSHPHDTYDFSRCIEIIEQLQITDNQIDNLANISPEWNKLVDKYYMIKELIETGSNQEAYQLIKDCIKSAQSKNKP